MHGLLSLAILCLFSPPATAERHKLADFEVEVTEVASGFDTPWGLAFLPGGGALVTERGGRLWRLSADGTRTRVRGVPKVATTGQGGLLDVLLPRDFAETRHVILSYAKPMRRGSGTAVGMGRLSRDGRRLTGFRVLVEMAPGTTGGRHFGSRLVEGRDGAIYVTVGDRGDRPSAQDPGRINGSVLRIARDGRAPADNPFVSQAGARPEIWSLGHRNPQGMALDPSGQLWAVEHGAQGGDEINRIKRGANYGWPVISYGQHYSGNKIGEGTSKPGMEQPAHYWDPSIAPSGMAILGNDLFPEWAGDFLVGSLKFDMISRLENRAGRLTEVERIALPETQRVRDVREAPDGSVWFLSEGNGAIYRMTPAR
ncbi:PQQ-dependent sugar dehydrogenase [Aliiruegeria haliotis]|nr:PQQ-dependent sugar dehydrogenase [Aliiruegeria haliotis]